MRRVRLSLCLFPHSSRSSRSAASGCRGSAQAGDDPPDRSQAPSRRWASLGSSTPGQLAAEAHAIAVPTPENARKLLRTLTAEPHVAGTPADHKTAVFVRDKLREWGWKADLAEMEVLLNYPASRAGRRYSNRPVHEGIAARRGTRRHRQGFRQQPRPSAPSMDMASRATPRPGRLRQLRPPRRFRPPWRRWAIDVKDKIVLVRYGEIFRGLKVRNAQKRGARGS